MYSDEEGIYCSKFMQVVKAFIPMILDDIVFWHVFLVAVKECV